MYSLRVERLRTPLEGVFSSLSVRVIVVPMQVHSISEIDASQDGENVGLNEGDEDFQTVDRNRECERQPADQKRQRKGHSEEDSQNGMARRHVREQSNRQ